jgi:hypothetical protein
VILSAPPLNLSLKARITIFLGLWVIVGLLFAFAPYAPTDEKNAEIRAFVVAPLMFVAGFITLFTQSGSAPTSDATAVIEGVVLVLGLLYFAVHIAMMLTQARRRTILILCAVHLALTIAAVAGLVRHSWESIGG